MSRVFRFLLLSLPVSLFFGFHQPVHSQNADTLYLSFPEFHDLALEASKELDARRKQVDISEARFNEANALRILPNLNIVTAHGLIPGVKASDPNIPQSQLYLDPGLRNDWEDWGFFNQFEISGIQPLFTWGAVGNAVNAAREGINVSRFGYETEENKYGFQLFQLYQGMLLTMELQRIMEDAIRTLNRAERELQKMLEEGDDSIEDADVYQFEIFKYQLFAQADEVDQNLAFFKRAMKMAVGLTSSPVVVLPKENFLDPIGYDLMELDFYVNHALFGRPEVRQLDAVKSAAKYGLDATIAQSYPTLFLGISGRYAFAPNRPRQMNPFISNPSNTSSLLVGFGFQQSLNFRVLRSRTDRSRHQYRQAVHATEAVRDGVMLDVEEKYKDYIIALSRYENTEKSLDVSRQWLRQEQLDYDLGFGDVLNLVDAMKSNLELEATLKQRIQNLNVSVGRLHTSSGISLKELYE